ncbi:MAG TPA: anti-sigma factor [Solirubrobacteraceae bacterium]
MNTTCPYGLDTGAYVLGALLEEEQRDFTEHLRDCADCRREVAELRIAADVLPLAAEQIEPPAHLRRRIMDVVHEEARLQAAARGERTAGRARPRRRRWRLPGIAPIPAAIAACVLLALGVVTGVLIDRSGSTTREVPAQIALSGASATLRVDDDGDARLQLRDMPQPPAGRVYQVWLKRPGAAPAPTDALFAPSRDGAATVDVPGGVRGVAQVLVTDEPRGGSRKPTRTPVIVASPGQV